MNATIHNVLFLTAPARRRASFSRTPRSITTYWAAMNRTTRSGKQRRLECPEPAKSRLAPAREDRHAGHQEGQHHSVEEDGQGLELVQNERPSEEQAEADHEDERGRPESELKQPAGFGGKLGAVGRGHPSGGHEGACGRISTGGGTLNRLWLGRLIEVGHKALNIPALRRAWQIAGLARRTGRSRFGLRSTIGLRRTASAGPALFVLAIRRTGLRLRGSE